MVAENESEHVSAHGRWRGTRVRDLDIAVAPLRHTSEL